MTSGELTGDISQEELDFSDLFLYNSPREDFSVHCDTGALLQNDDQAPIVVVDHQNSNISNSNQPASSQDLLPHDTVTENLSGRASDSLGLPSRCGTIPAPSPRIEITPWDNSLSAQSPEQSHAATALGTWRESVSPASSNSSSGWPAEAYSPVPSPCVSPSNEACGLELSGTDLCLGLQGICTSSVHSSPGASPHNSNTDETFLQPQHQRTTTPMPNQRSRSASPHVKRSYDQTHSVQGGTPAKQRSRSPSPIPSPHEQQGSYYLHHYQAQAQIQLPFQTTSQGMEEMLNICSSCLGPSVMVQDANVPLKRQDCVYGEEYDWAVWPSPHPGHHEDFSGPRVSPFLSLDWPLSSQSGQYELLIRQQPKSHHRAQYETEGSRGAVKTSDGGHLEIQLRGYQGAAPLGLQVFIGTADERLLKPHAFYQVHRVTGKTVTTPSIEKTINGTKVLEIPLEPEKLMTAVIDCVGILKLRNADIELRNGETDFGRRNTRVRLVFRVHIPQPAGGLISLQVVSDPIECSQRSAKELPEVKRQDLDCGSVLGGQQMVLTGQHFTSTSEVMFSEKAQDGQQIWETEAGVVRDKTQAKMLFVEVPPYREQIICQPAKVNFQVINGKRRCSPPQHFMYTPAREIKTEPLDDQMKSISNAPNQSLTSLSMKSRYHHHLEQDSGFQALNISPSRYRQTTEDPRDHLLTTDPLGDQPFYSQSTAGTQHYSQGSTNLLDGWKSSPSGNIFSREKAINQVRPGSQHVTQTSLGRGNYEVRAAGRVRQDNLQCSYLEDVTDVIRRDLNGLCGD